MQKIPVSEALVREARRLREPHLPKFALGESSAEEDAPIWIAHCHFPQSIFRLEFGFEALLAFNWGFEPSLEIVNAAEQYAREQLAPTILGPIRYRSWDGNLSPSDVFLTHGTEWQGLFHTEPAFIGSLTSPTFLPLEDCENIVPHIQACRKWYVENIVQAYAEKISIEDN